MSAVLIVVRHAGCSYRIERCDGANGPGTVQDLFPGVGVVGSERRWLGDRYAVRPVWYAALNPTGKPGAALARADGLPSRRAALDWLFAHADSGGAR